MITYLYSSLISFLIPTKCIIEFYGTALILGSGGISPGVDHFTPVRTQHCHFMQFSNASVEEFKGRVCVVR